MPKSKISMQQIKKISPILLLRLIKKIKQFIKSDDVMLRIFKEYNIDIDEVDYIPTYFADIDVSAKCDHAVVYLNWKLLEDGFDFKDLSYLIHEYTHWLQQTTGDKPTQSSNDGEYLENPYEQEGFQNQVEYIAEHIGDDEAEKYVDHLLEYHEVDDKDNKEELEDILMEKI